MLRNFKMNSPPAPCHQTMKALQKLLPCPVLHRCLIQRMRNSEGPFCEQFRSTVFRIFCRVIYSPNLLLALPSFLDGVNLAVLCACLANLHVRSCQRGPEKWFLRWHAKAIIGELNTKVNHGFEVVWNKCLVIFLDDVADDILQWFTVIW